MSSRTVTILGATGSVGGSTLDLIEREPDRFAIEALTAQSDVAGSWLGLSVCEGLIRAHGGIIWAESEPGVGSTFSFALPAECTESPSYQPAIMSV